MGGRRIRGLKARVGGSAALAEGSQIEQWRYTSWRSLNTNQQLHQCGGAVPDSIWVGSKWLLAFPRVPVTPVTSLRVQCNC